MIRRKTQLKRTPLKRSASRMPRIKPERAAQKREYAKRLALYLFAHPLDMVTIFMHRFDEAEVIFAARDWWRGKPFVYRGITIQWSDQVHHRNRGRGARLNDERWWLATALASHQFVELNAGLARQLGLLLPAQADAEGRWGDGNQALPTPELMKARAAR